MRRLALGFVVVACLGFVAASCSDEHQVVRPDNPEPPSEELMIINEGVDLSLFKVPDCQVVIFVAADGDTTPTTWGRIKWLYKAAPDPGDSCQCGNEM